MQEVEYEGWRCGLIESGPIQAYVTLDVGPRVIGFHYKDSPNFFFIKPETRGRTGLTGYNGYGGHRLWTSPELVGRTYDPENDRVETMTRPLEDERCPSLRMCYGFRPKLGPSMIDKVMFVAPFNGGLELSHQLVNRSPISMDVAPWAITVMRPGGECLVPGHKVAVEGPEQKLPSRPIVTWPYTRLDDPRLTLADDALRLAQNPLIDGPTKIGTFVEEGIAVYAIDGLLFIKRFSTNRFGHYPDYGCNFEAYTRHDMLEVETLGELVRLAPGETTHHYESWFVFEGEVPNEDLTPWFDELWQETNMLRFGAT